MKVAIKYDNGGDFQESLSSLQSKQLAGQLAAVQAGDATSINPLIQANYFEQGADPAALAAKKQQAAQLVSYAQRMGGNVYNTLKSKNANGGGTSIDVSAGAQVDATQKTAGDNVPPGQQEMVETPLPKDADPKTPPVGQPSPQYQGYNNMNGKFNQALTRFGYQGNKFLSAFAKQGGVLISKFKPEDYHKYKI